MTASKNIFHSGIFLVNLVIEKQIKSAYQKLGLLVVLFIIPFAAISSSDKLVDEKRTMVAMRTIGHQVLLSIGDSDSRIMPIEKTDGYFKIPFGVEFGFDPGDIVSIIDSIMRDTKFASHVLVEVGQCDSNEIVHSFEIKNEGNSSKIACIGRKLPKDCYSLFVTIIDSSGSGNQSPDKLSSSGLSIISSKFKESKLFQSAFLLTPLILLLGFLGYFINKKNEVSKDPNLILIGSSEFDTRNMSLSYQDKRVELSYKEAQLLSLLHTSANTPIAREVLLQRVWGDEGGYVGRTLDVFISKLRKKLEADASVKIVNIRGVGYKLVMKATK